MTTSGATAAAASGRNFLQVIIEKDLAPGGSCHARPDGHKIQTVVPILSVCQTRFPPEPNGYLHIGHAKAICINFGLAKKYDGLCNLRFDDTNPSAEEVEYVNSIKEDVEWLGFTPAKVCFASDYFDTFYAWAEHLISRGLAFVDLEPNEVMKEKRRTAQESGCRNQSIEENMTLFRKMRDGGFQQGEALLRAKIDMTSPNMNMRDPAIYRVMHKHHHRTGNKWCIYPLYDFAHGQEDAIEEVTHSICTLEFENHQPLYQWFLKNLPIPGITPRQLEMARLNLTDTLMSKRKLLKLVKLGIVEGWDDPRMPTIRGLRRRGIRPEAIRAFCERIGATTSNSVVDMSVLEDVVRTDLDEVALRRFVVLDPIKVEISSLPSDYPGENCEGPQHPLKPDLGVRTLRMTREIYIDREDFREEAPPDYFRLKPGGEVKLRHSYVIKCESFEKDSATGKVTLIRASHDPSTKEAMPADRKVKGVIHWVSADPNFHVRGECRLYNPILLRAQEKEQKDWQCCRQKAEAAGEPAEDQTDLDGGSDPDDTEDDGSSRPDWFKQLNPESLVCHSDAVFELSLKDAAPGSHYQFERVGYFVVDAPTLSAPAAHLRCNRVVGLVESGLKKKEGKDANRSRKEEQDRAKAEKEARLQIAPEFFFRECTDFEGKFSEFDVHGFPTKDAEGEDLTKSMKKKLEKELEKHKKQLKAAGKL